MPAFSLFQISSTSSGLRAGQTSNKPTPRSPVRRHALGIVLALALFFATGAAATACTLDGIASLSVNGVTAALTSGHPTRANAGYWAPFTLLAQGSGSTLRFSENMRNVAQSLPPAMLATPFRWDFGDGATASGFTVRHAYAHAGWYKITVRYEWPARHQWIVFDSAEQQVVAAGDVWKAHLSRYLDNALQLALNGAIWLIVAVVLVAMVWEALRRRERRFR